MNELVGDAKEFFVVPLEQFLDKLSSNKIAYSEQLEESNLILEYKDMFRKMNEYNYILTKFNYDKFNHYHLKEHPILPNGYNDLVLNMDIDDNNSFHFDKTYRTLIVEHFRLTSKNALIENPNLSLVNFVDNKIKDIKSTEIKDQIISMLFRTQIKLDNKNIDSDYKRIHNLLSSKNLKEKLTEKYKAIGISKPETTAASFNYENHKGGTTSLNDLKGKILYIDIWATWCGPCINEMPALTELIKYFKGKNIEFVNISIDTKNKYDKWLEYDFKPWIGNQKITRFEPEDDNQIAGDDGYEGAIVLNPQPGLYLETPVAVLDYASLYPSSMISENLSLDSIILPGS